MYVEASFLVSNLTFLLSVMFWGEGRGTSVLTMAFSPIRIALIVVCLLLWTFASISSEDIDGSIEAVMPYLPFPHQACLVAFFPFEEEESEVKHHCINALRVLLLHLCLLVSSPG